MAGRPRQHFVTFTSDEVGVVDPEHGEQYGDVPERGEELVPGPSLVRLCAQAVDAVAEEQRSRNKRGREIDGACDAEGNEQKRHRHQYRGVPNDVAPRPALVIWLIRLHLQPGPSKFLAPNQADGEKVRHLPQKHDCEEQNAGQVEATGRRGPADERRNGSRHRADQSAAAVYRFIGV